jgi:GT2 family glycosyltransferase
MKVAAVVVDYKAPDLTQQCIDALSSDDVMVIRVDNSVVNRGFAAGCNSGIEKALALGASSVLLLNNDAIVRPDTVARMLARMTPGIGAVGCVILNTEGTVQLFGGGYVKLGRSRTLKSSGNIDWLSGCCMLISREALIATGGLDEGFFMYWEDVDLSFRIRKAGLALAVAEDAFVTHLGGAAQHSPRSLIRFFRKHYKLWPVHVAVAAGLRVLHR